MNNKKSPLLLAILLVLITLIVGFFIGPSLSSFNPWFIVSLFLIGFMFLFFSQLVGVHNNTEQLNISPKKDVFLKTTAYVIVILIGFFALAFLLFVFALRYSSGI